MTNDNAALVERVQDWLENEPLAKPPYADIATLCTALKPDGDAVEAQGISACNKCGAQYPSAPAGTVHKCGRCSGGYCSPITTRPDTEAERLLRGMVSQLDHVGCTCTFPGDDCCSYAAAETYLTTKGGYNA